MATSAATKTPHGRGHERADDPSEHDESTDAERGEIDQSDGRLRRVAEHLGPASPRHARSARPASSENAISAAKKSGVARMPATESGAFGARRIRAHLQARPASITRGRNSRVRSSRGAEKICEGGPSSRITPSSRKHTLSASSRAKAISCVAMIIVIPSSASWRTNCEDLAHELRVERARDLVEQHEARVHRQRARDRDALLLAAGEAVRILVRLVLEPDHREQLPSLLQARRRFDSLSARIGARVTFSSTVMCGNRLYAWKTMPIFRRSALTSTFPPVST